MLLHGGLGWRFGYTTDDVRISAVVSVRLSLPEQAGQAAESVLLPLHPHGEHTQALAQAQDYASWHKVQAAQSYTGFVVYALSRGALPTNSSPHLHPPTWPGSLSLSCVYPAPQRASTLELLLEAPTGYGAFWGRCILQAVFLPKGGVA